MNARGNPVTRPSVYRTQDAHGSFAGTDLSSAATYTPPHAQHVSLRTSSLAAPPAAGGGVSRSASAENLSFPLTLGSGADSFNGLHRSGTPTSPGIARGGGLPRHPSVRTFSQLSAIPIATPTTAYYQGESPVQAWAEYSRAAPVSPSESPGNAPFGADTLLQRPLGPDTVREAVYAYLEATDRHDVVMAMLTDERRHTQRSLGTACAPFQPSGNPQHATEAPAFGDDAASTQRRSDRRGSADGASSAPLSSSPGRSGIASNSGVSASASHLLASPRDGAALGGMEGRRGRQRRSHDLLRKGLLERRTSEQRPHGGEEPPSTAGVGSLSPHPTLRRGHASASPDPAPRPQSPPLPDGAGAHVNRPQPTQRQHLPKILPTLCGLEEAVRPDLILLFSDLERKIREQYRQLNIPPPSHEVLQYILTQTYEPMWSVGEDANVFHLFEPANPVTGMVLYGTLNQMVEQLTQVHVMPLSTPPDIVLKSARSFSEAFLRRHRLLMPSHVLLAKLMERYLVPLSLHLGFERFKVHGITVHIPGMGASLPARRSQSETVLHGRRHPGAANSGGAATTSASVGGQSLGVASGESGVWGSRSAREPPTGTAEPTPYKPSTNAAVEEYVRATAAATSPDAALIAMLRSGMLPALTSDSMAALTSAAIGTLPASTLTSNPASTTLPHRGASGGFPNAAAAAAAAGAAGGSRPVVELVTTYSASATLWLTVCERVQLKVLSVLLFWLQHHPHHFDGEMLRSVLHFVESCCYGTSEWADAPSRQPQIAEFIRQACHAALPLSSTRRIAGGGANGYGNGSYGGGGAPVGLSTSPHVLGTAAQLASFPPISKEWRDGVLSGTWERRRHQLLSDAIPPSLRQSVKAELLPWTWITPMGSLTPRQYLPCFSFRTLPSADIMSYPGEERHQQCYGRDPRRSGAGTTHAQHDPRGGASDVTKLHAVAQEALRLFGSCTFETYVRGLTAAHYRMFTSFPSQDIFIAAQHTSSSYLTSPSFQSSFLGRFLNSSAFLTSWCVSLLLHAAYLDGERAAAVVAVTNMSILNSFVGDMTDYRAPAASEGDGDGDAGVGGGAESGVHSRSSSISIGNSSLSTASAATASVGAVSQNGAAGGNGQDGGDLAGAASANGRQKTFLHNPGRQFLHVLDRLVDLVVGFLRVNNLHASYSIFRGFSHPFVRKLLQHRRIRPHIHAQTAHRIRKLEGFFTSIPPSSAASASASGGGGGGTVASGSATGKHSSGSAAAAADEADPTMEDDLDAAAEGNTEGGTASPTSESAPRRARKAHHSFFEYLNTVPDSVEYPTVPVVQYYLRELQMMFALEPTFFTVPSHQMQSRFVSEEVRLTGVFTVPSAGLEEEQTPTAASPIAVVNWRKMHLVDDWIQRVSSNQMSCLHYISSRSTVVRNIMPDLEFEKSFEVQLSRVVVTNTSLLQEMANQLYGAL